MDLVFFFFDLIGCIKNSNQGNVSYFNPGRISRGPPGSCFPNWLEGKPRMRNPEYLNSSCSAFSSNGQCGRIRMTGGGLTFRTNTKFSSVQRLSYPCTGRCTLSTWRHWRRGRPVLWTHWSPSSGPHREPELCNHKWYQGWSNNRAGQSDTDKTVRHRLDRPFGVSATQQ